jgi:hypothetical protein
MKAAVRITFELNSSVLYNLTAKCLMTPEDSSNGKDQTSCGDTTRSKADGATHLVRYQMIGQSKILTEFRIILFDYED